MPVLSCTKLYIDLSIVYDLVAGTKCIKSSYVLSKEKAIELFPMLRKDKLCGAIVYYDGQHNDARMNIAIALTAARLGATVANHVRVVSASSWFLLHEFYLNFLNQFHRSVLQKVKIVKTKKRSLAPVCVTRLLVENGMFEPSALLMQLGPLPIPFEKWIKKRWAKYALHRLVSTLCCLITIARQTWVCLILLLRTGVLFSSCRGR